MGRGIENLYHGERTEATGSGQTAPGSFAVAGEEYRELVETVLFGQLGRSHAPAVENRRVCAGSHEKPNHFLALLAFTQDGYVEWGQLNAHDVLGQPYRLAQDDSTIWVTALLEKYSNPLG